MSRSILFCVAFAVVPLSFACDKSGAIQQAAAAKAQEKANSDVAKANDDANAKAAAAQAEADKKIAVVLQLEFAKMRDDYRRQMQANLDSLNKTIAELETKAQTATGEAKTALDGVLPLLETRRNAFANDLPAIDGASAGMWDGMKARIDGEWTDLKATADRAAT